ncbi:MAG: DUF951 domain-containing protein [Bacillota bacterium]|nr:DUF951 domain-containing protein [Bacillota bacterium]
MPLKIELGDTVELKKQHPCGGREFEVLRTGMDFRLRCKTCGHQIWLPRPELEKRVKRVVPGGGHEGNDR